MLDNAYQDAEGSVRLEAIGADSAMLIRVTVQNAGSRAHRFAVQAEVLSGWVAHNSAWMDPIPGRPGLLRAEIDPPSRQLPDQIVLHLRHPRRFALRTVRVNGKQWADFDSAREIVRLPSRNGNLRVEAYY